MRLPTEQALSTGENDGGEEELKTANACESRMRLSSGPAFLLAAAAQRAAARGSATPKQATSCWQTSRVRPCPTALVRITQHPFPK